jgi:hypothetical protein
MKIPLIIPIGLAMMCACSAVAEIGAVAEAAFDRIMHGWTNYSTAFNATESLDKSGEYASVASFYRPGCDARLVEYRTIVIWAGSLNQQVDFANFDFTVFVWSGADAFIKSPRRGDITSIPFAAPTGGSQTIADAITRSGRPAYELRFCLTNADINLEHGRSYLVGFGARNHANGYPDLFVPTSMESGESDLQAGNILVAGWIELANAGGATVYSGRLATALYVQSMFEPPTLKIAVTNQEVELTWPAGSGCFSLEEASIPLSWSRVSVTAGTEGTLMKVLLPGRDTMRWFRLKKQ